MKLQRDSLWFSIDLNEPGDVTSVQTMDELYNKVQYAAYHVHLSMDDFKKKSLFFGKYSNTKALDYVPLVDLDCEKVYLLKNESMVDPHIRIQDEIHTWLPTIKYQLTTDLYKNKGPKRFSKLKLEVVKLFKNKWIPGLQHYEKFHIVEILKNIQQLSKVHTIEYGTTAAIFTYSAFSVAALEEKLLCLLIYFRFMLHEDSKKQYIKHLEVKCKQQQNYTELYLYCRFLTKITDYLPKVIAELDNIAYIKKKMEWNRQMMAVLLCESTKAVPNTKLGEEIWYRRQSSLVNEDFKILNNLNADKYLCDMAMSSNELVISQESDLDCPNNTVNNSPISVLSISSIDETIAATLKEQSDQTTKACLKESEKFKTNKSSTSDKIEEFFSMFPEAKKKIQSVLKVKMKPNVKKKKRKSQKARLFERKTKIALQN